ncbi:MAG: DinB family protein [Candidatus Hodarchaeota archaeon]
MNETSFRNRLKEIIGMIRRYGNRMLDGLTAEELIWRPEGTRGRTIQSYFRHMINAEIYWLRSLEDNSFDYMPKSASFNDLFEIFTQLESHLIDSVENAPEEQLVLRIPIFDGEKIIMKGTLAWMIMRTSLHAIHHFGQISHIRYSFENPPLETKDDLSWGKIMDTISFLKPDILDY